MTHSLFVPAVIAGTAIALAAGLIGYFVVLRAQVFATDALSHASFTGSLAALAVGADPRLGLFVVTIGVGLAIALLGGERRADDVVIGIVFAWVLGLGVFFLSRYTTGHSAGNGAASISALFGSLLGLTTGAAVFAAAVAFIVVIALLLIARPLLFASIDEAVAVARGVPVRLLGIGFLGLLGATAAEASQAVGALLLLGLIAAPAGAASLLTDRPYRGLLLSGVIAVGCTWFGLGAAFTAPRVPPSVAIVLMSGGVLGAAIIRRGVLNSTRHRTH